MAHDASVADERVHTPRREARDALEVEARERASEGLSLAEDSQPAQTRLEAFEADFLEQPMIVGDRTSPLGVVVRPVVFTTDAPPASWPAVGSGEHVRGASRHGGTIAERCVTSGASPSWMVGVAGEVPAPRRQARDFRL
jgi:hypothetical protein